ncbi:hypothetical protein G3A44_15550, partial [Ideonella sp. TBM-1]|nr:hypothetical protein [Ideonella livida]
MSAGLRGARADVVRLAGAAVVAQLLPLAVLPWLTRLVAPAALGHWALWTSVAANLATVACGRYEYAIVRPRHPAAARGLLALCLVLAAAGAAGALVLAALAVGAWGGLGGGAAGSADLQAGLQAWLGQGGGLLAWALAPALGLAGLVQALTLWHNRAGDFRRIGQARLLAPGLTAALQAVAAWAGAGA